MGEITHTHTSPQTETTKGTTLIASLTVMSARHAPAISRAPAASELGAADRVRRTYFLLWQHVVGADGAWWSQPGLLRDLATFAVLDLPKWAGSPPLFPPRMTSMSH